MGLNKRLWSPACWYLLHLIAYFYQPILWPDYQAFYKKLGIILPCQQCRQHYRQYCRDHPLGPDLDLVQWTIDYHNAVNQFTNGPQLSRQQVDNLMFFKGNLPINHHYIWVFLKVLKMYHTEEKHLSLYRQFLRTFVKVIPCNRCKNRLSKLELDISDIQDYLKIIKNHHQKKAGKIKFKV